MFGRCAKFLQQFSYFFCFSHFSSNVCHSFYNLRLSLANFHLINLFGLHSNGLFHFRRHATPKNSCHKVAKVKIKSRNEISTCSRYIETYFNNQYFLYERSNLECFSASFLFVRNLELVVFFGSKNLYFLHLFN